MLGYSIDMTLWGEHCRVEGGELPNVCFVVSHPIQAIKGGCVAEFNDKTIGTISKTNI